MGTNRGKSSRHGIKSKSTHRTTGTSAALPSWAKSQPISRKPRDGHHRLPAFLPRRGMIYPIKGRLMRLARQDVAVQASLKKVMPMLATSPIDTLFSRIFREAVELLRANELGSFDHDAIFFLKTLRTRPALQPWAEGLCDNYFIILFLALRGARQIWHENPREPFNIEEHCQVARAIDAFREVDTLDWDSPAVREWLMLGGSKYRDEDLQFAEREDDAGGDDGAAASHASGGGDEDDKLFVKQDHPISQDMGHKTEIGAEWERMRRELEEATRQLRPKIDMRAAEVAFRKMCLEDRVARPTRKNGNPFHDESDEEMEDGGETKMSLE
jgi:hypothetical protein